MSCIVIILPGAPAEQLRDLGAADRAKREADDTMRWISGAASVRRGPWIIVDNAKLST